MFGIGDTLFVQIQIQIIVLLIQMPDTNNSTTDTDTIIYNATDIDTHYGHWVLIDTAAFHLLLPLLA
jgi:hypothetical protein